MFIIQQFQGPTFHGSWRENLYHSQRRSVIKEPLIQKPNLGGTKEKKKSMQSSQQNHNYENDKRKLKSVTSDPTHKTNAHVSVRVLHILFNCIYLA